MAPGVLPRPECWQNDVRMNALFAPCKHKSIAPESWQMKMTFWSEQLRVWCRHRKSPLVSVSAARDAHVRKGNRPACLDVLLEELIRNGEYSPVSKYTGALSSAGEGWVRWGARKAFRPAGLAIGFLASYLPFGRVPDDGMATSSLNHDDELVSEVVVKELATELLRNYPEELDRLGTLEDLMESAGFAPAELDSFKVIIGYMITAGWATKKGDLIKLADAGTSKAAPVSECEESLHRLLAAERRLLGDTERYQKEAEQALADTRAALKLDNKAQAKAHLRRKHRCAERAASSTDALENVRQMLHQLRQTEMNTTVLNTYKMSVDAMKRAMREGDLDEDSAHQTMDDLKEVLETYGEVERALAGSTDERELAELEDELEVLMAAGPPPDDDKKEPVGRRGGREEREFRFDGEDRMLAELNELSLPERAEGGARRGRERVALPDGGRPGDEKSAPKPRERAQPPEPPSPERTKAWYPPAEGALLDNAETPWQLSKIEGLERSGAAYRLEALARRAGEVRADTRLHPGQRMDPRGGGGGGPVLYNTDFEVQDHKLNDGVWLFNSKDDLDNRNTPERTPGSTPRKTRIPSDVDFTNSTEYPDSNANQPAGFHRTPGSNKAGAPFQVAPGGERAGRHEPWSDPEDSGLDDLERRLKNLRS